MEQGNSVILVDLYGNALFDRYGGLSTSEKMEAHRHGLLHRAVSVFILNEKNELLIQKRAVNKYHSPEKWSNTCCIHPLPGETPPMAARRRLIEEMGVLTKLTEIFSFLYHVDVGSGFVEHEFVHVFRGRTNQDPKINHTEVSDWKWMKVEDLRQELVKNPEDYSTWLRQAFSKVLLIDRLM